MSFLVGGRTFDNMYPVYKSQTNDATGKPQRRTTSTSTSRAGRPTTTNRQTECRGSRRNWKEKEKVKVSTPYGALLRDDNMYVCTYDPQYTDDMTCMHACANYKKNSKENDPPEAEARVASQTHKKKTRSTQYVRLARC